MTQHVEPERLLPPPPGSYFMARRAAASRLAGSVIDITGYHENFAGHFRQVEAASLVFPLVISFAAPFAIGLGRAPGGNDRYTSFAAGLYAGPVVIDSFGACACVQVNFTPLGARRFFGMPLHELADRMVALDDLLGSAGTSLRDRLGEEPDWQRRFDIVEAFVATRLSEAPSAQPAVAWAYEALVRTGGDARIAAVAKKLDWSRKHLAQKFRSEIGLGPKAVARIMRFNRAQALARDSLQNGWADIAVASGYADQAHLVREFRELAGETPTAWQARLS